MSIKSIELRQKRQQLVQEMHDLTEKTGFAAEAQARWAELDKEQKSLETQINAIEATDKLNDELRQSKNGHRETAQPGADTRNTTQTKAERLNEIRSSEAYTKSFDSYIRSGVADANMHEVRTYAGLEALVGNSTGEFLVPVGFQKELEIKLKAYGGMRNACKVISTSTGNPLQWPTMDDTANNGEWLAEANAIGQVNPTFNRVTFTSNVASSKQVLLSVQLLQDSAFDVQSTLADAFAIRLGRRVNLGYTKGSGSGQPAGLVPAVVAFNSGSQIVTAVGANATNNPGATRINSVNIVDDLDGLITAVDPAYRAGAKFMANQATLDTFRKQKDGFGRPLWNVSVSEDEPDTIYGYSYQWNQDMDTNRGFGQHGPVRELRALRHP